MGLQSSGNPVLCLQQTDTMSPRHRTRRAFPTVQAWMDATGTNNRRLAGLLGITESHLSNVLRKSRKCSLYLALKISKLTNVPIETICEWPPEYEESVK